MTIVAIESKFLKADWSIPLGITRVKIITEAQPTEKEFEGKLKKGVECEVECEIPTKDVKTWGMNITSQKSLMKLFGPDTKNWVGKTVKIQYVNVQGSDKKSIQVDEIETEKINK